MVTRESQPFENEPEADRHRSVREPEDHVRFEILLERHLDGELSEKEREELFAHLELCDRCRQILEAEEMLVDQLSRVPRLMPPSDLRARILEEVARQREQLMQGWPIFQEPPASVSPTPLGRTQRASWWAGGFLLLSAIFFLLTVDLQNVPLLDVLQTHLRSVARFVWQECRLFLEEAAGSSRDQSHGNAPQPSSVPDR